MRIAIDAMGGDKAPKEIISGALESLDMLSRDDEIILVGPEDQIRLLLPSKINGKISIVHAPDIIGMAEPPVDSLRKKPKSSIAILAKLGKKNEADSVISAGNTGACVAAFQMRMRNLPGVVRPGITVVFPTPGGPVTICDVGANIACKPIHLYQYGVMASIYSKSLLGIENPRVGIMSIGEEDAKGNEVVKKTRDLIKADKKINFIGNIEGRDIFQGTCDVIICEGFVGNVMLKLTEGLVEGLFRAIKHELMEEKISLALKFKPVMMRIYQKYDYNTYGGALLLGIDGTAIICHGASESRTIKNAIMASKKFYLEKINNKIVEYFSDNPLYNSLQESQSQDTDVRTIDE
jgi:glycerol-3-phosphate acyltransferase PlsX